MPSYNLKIDMGETYFYFISLYKIFSKLYKFADTSSSVMLVTKI